MKNDTKEKTLEVIRQEELQFSSDNDALKEMDYISFYQQHIEKLKQVTQIEWQGHCPFSEGHSDGVDSKPSFYVNSKTGQYYCQACMARGNLIIFCKNKGIPIPDKLKRSGIKKKWQDPIAVFDYTDENGTLFYQACRFPDIILPDSKPQKNFKQRRPDGKGGWIYQVKGIRKVPYRLPDLLKADPDFWVFIPEGEKHCDRLYGLGLVATCNVAGAEKWTKALNLYLKNRRVCILPDNDLPGQRHGQKVAQNLHGIAKEIRTLNLPGLKPKGDIVNWLDDGHTKEELFSLLDKMETWEPSQKQTGEEEYGEEAEEKEKRKSLAARLAEMVLSDSEITLFHNEKKTGYFKRGKDILPLKSRGFKDYLRKMLWEREGQTCGNDTIESAVGTISAYAVYDYPEHKLDVRVTKRDEKYYYDLGGGRVVYFEKGKPWKILPETPILFRSFTHQKEQVIPENFGDLKKILNFINFKKEESTEGKLSSHQLLYLCYLVSCLVPNVPHPVIILTGDQGSGKSTLFRITKPVVDPSHVLTIGNPSDFKEFVQIADHHYVLYLDNLTHLSDWTSDALCRFCTGEGFSKRELFSDDEDVFYVFRRCVGLNGINLVASRADLLDRSLIFSLERISDNERQHEQHFYAEFEKALPFIIAGLFDIFSSALNYIDDIRLTSKPRMADFARWGCAIARALGHTDQDFLAAYYQNVNLQNEEALDASPVAKTIIAYMEDKTEVIKPSSELYEELKKTAEGLKINTNSKYWPQDSRWLLRRIKEIRPNLQAVGIETYDSRNNKTRYVTLYKVKNDVTDVTDVTGTKKQILNGDIIGDNIIFQKK